MSDEKKLDGELKEGAAARGERELGENAQAVGDPRGERLRASSAGDDKVLRMGTASIPRLITEFAIPSVVGMLINGSYAIIDSVFLGHAVGEIGLDHHWPVPREEQYALFEAQLQLARELDLPVSVHDREAHAEMYDLLRKYKPRGALHCYSGSADDAAWLVEQGMYLGFGGAVTYKGAKRAAKVLAAIPHDRALLETDCPYMAPEPVRGTRNDSRNIAHVAAYIGTIWDMDAQAVLDQTAENARRCFGL